MLTLKDFVKQTLTEVTDALAEFSQERGHTGAITNPPIVNGETAARNGLLLGEYNDRKERHDLIMPVAFDVAVTATDTNTAKAGAGIKVVSFFKADGSLETGNQATSANRVQFTVPLRLPDAGEDGRSESKPSVGFVEII